MGNTMKNRSPYLIIGNSAAAMGGVAGIRGRDADGLITIVNREQRGAYYRPLISYLLGGKVDEGKMPYRPSAMGESNLRLLQGVEARRIDVGGRIVETADGQSLGFENLLVATGGRPIVPKDLPGREAEGVFTFTTWDDAEKVRDFIEENEVKEAVVVGGGLIGLKCVEALTALRIKTTIAELAERILSTAFDETASQLALNSLKKAGAEVRCSTTASRILTKEGKVAGVALTDGTEVSCSLVVFTIGVAPEKSIVEGTAIRTDRGILVDSSMRTSVEGIYAAGDVAQAEDLLSGEKRCIAILPLAYRQGFIAGSNMAGGEAKYEGGLVMNAVDVCDLPTISVGMTSPQGEGYEVLSVLDEKAPVYKKIVLKDDRIVGAIFVGQIDRAGIITGLIKKRISVSGFKSLLLTDAFGLLSLPAEYRKHLVSGMGTEV